tara:strand:- start:5881 stop:6576 length:696 start_codon:yes stop_codon:yes gene_type:complete
MSSIPLTTVQEVIERSLFERLRTECVDKGYLPDITTFPETPTGNTDYIAAIKTISDSAKGFAIEPFQNSSSQAKGMKRVPRIVINPQPFMEGALGGDSSRVYQLNGTTYDAKVLPPQTSEYYFNVHLVSSSATQMRILNAIMSLSIPVRGYIPFYNNSNFNFFVRKLSGYNAPQTDEGIQETVYRFQVPDVFEVEDNIVATGIAKLNKITLDNKVQDAKGGTYNTDDLIVE